MGDNVGNVAVHKDGTRRQADDDVGRHTRVGACDWKQEATATRIRQPSLVSDVSRGQKQDRADAAASPTTISSSNNEAPRPKKNVQPIHR